MWHRLFMVLFLSVCSAFLFRTAKAQTVGQPYRINDKEVERILHRIEQQSDHFRSSLDSALDKSRLNGSHREDDINAFVKDFYRQTKNLRDRFNAHKSTSPDVQAVLDEAARIDAFMRRYPLTAKAQDEWSTLKSNLDELAAAYNVGWRWTEYPNGLRNDYPTGANVGVPYRVTDREVERILHNIEQQSDRFKSALDSALDKSRFNGSREEDDINRFVKEFYEQTKNLHGRFKDHKSTSADVQYVLDRAASIDSFMRRNQLRKNNVDKDWYTLKVDLEELARVYSVSWEWRS